MPARPLRRRKAETVTNTHIGPWAILVVVARETFYLDRRRSHSKQADVFFRRIRNSRERDGRRRCLLIPEGESISPVFPDASEIFLLRSSDRTGDCTFTKALTRARPALAEEESVAVEWHFSNLDTGKHRVTSTNRPRLPVLLFFPLPSMSQVSALPSSSLNHATTMPPDSSTDPKFLRQAALSTLKLKRRKLEASAPLSRPLSRPIAPTPSISLDYGQEEPSSTTSTPQQTPAPALARAPTPPQALASSSPPRAVQRDGSSGAASRSTPLDDDTSLREEGEISDNEDPPFRPLSKSIPAPITVLSAVYPDVRLEASGSAHSPSFGVLSRSPSVNAEEACQHAVPPSYVTTSVRRPSIEAQSTAPKASEPFRLETPLYVLDPDHVRPGLSCAPFFPFSCCRRLDQFRSDAKTI